MSVANTAQSWLEKELPWVLQQQPWAPHGGERGRGLGRCLKGDSDTMWTLLGHGFMLQTMSTLPMVGIGVIQAPRFCS